MKLNSLPYSRYWMPMSFIAMLFVSAFVISTLMNFTAAEVNTTGVYFEIDPATSMNTTEPVTIDIKVNSAPASRSFEVTLRFDKTILAITGVVGQLSGALPASHEILSIANAAGKITIGQAKIGGANFSGNTLLCSVNFTVKSSGKCVLELDDTFLELNEVVTYYPNNDGFFYATDATVHDVAVTSIALNDTLIKKTETVKITVNTTNVGTFDGEDFDVEVYADVVTHDPADPDVVDVGEILIGQYTVTDLDTTDPPNSTDVFWTPVGRKAEEYYISANATLTSATDEDPHDDILIDGTVKIDVDHDLKIASVTAPSEVWSREVVEIEFTVVNQGDSPEPDFDVTVTADGTAVGTVSVSGLASWDSETKSILWDTSNITKWDNGTYTITVTAPDLGEDAEDKADNSNTATVEVKPVHDMGAPNIGVPTIQGWVTWVFPLSITVTNEGTETETFEIYIYADTVLVDHLTGLTLTAENATEIPVTWDSEGVPPGHYVISAFVAPVPYETDTGDNWYTGSSILIKAIMGDVDYDGDVDVSDQRKQQLHMFEVVPTQP